MTFEKDFIIGLENKLDDLSAEIESISGNCDILTSAIENGNIASDVLYNAVFAMSKHLCRISDDISNIRIKEMAKK